MSQETRAEWNIIAAAERIQHEFEHYAPAIARSLAMLNSVNLGIVQVNPVVAAADNMYWELNGVMISEPNQVTHRPSEAALRSQWDFSLALLA